MPPILYLIDGHALAYRAYFAISGSSSDRLQTRAGEPTAGILGFANVLLKLLEQEKPEFLAVAFDVDSQLVGQTVHDTKVYHLEEMPRVVAELGVRVARLTVPASQAQQVAQCLADAGIVGILNFAPVTINLPDHVAVAGVDLAIELEQLVFAVVHRSAKP